MICLVMRNRQGTTVPCRNNHNCTSCGVPQKFGFVWAEGKAKWAQKYQVPTDTEAAAIICREALEEETQ